MESGDRPRAAGREAQAGDQMSKTDKGRVPRSPRVSAVSDAMLARYKGAQLVPTTRDEIETILAFLQDHATLTDMGEPAAARGAALEAVDIALRLAATPAPTDGDLSLKSDFLEAEFCPFAAAHLDADVARVVAAASAANRARGVERQRAWGQRRAPSGPCRSGRLAVDPTAPGATEARLREYADAAETIHEVRGLLMVLHVVSVDRQVLFLEGRVRTLVGAERFFCGLLRRLCVTKAISLEWSKVKVEVLSAAKADVLDADGPLRGQPGARALMVAMMDASIGIEGEGWPRSSSLH